MSVATPIRHATPVKAVKDVKPASAVQPAAQQAPPLRDLQPVIPTSWLAPDEQRRLMLWTFGLVEFMKVWDTTAPHFTELPTTLSAVTRVQGPWSAGVWTALEVSAVLAVSLLRIPNLSPGLKSLLYLIPVFSVWNLICWILADPLAFVPRVSMFGTVHLGEEGFLWGWLYLLRHVITRVIFGEPDHISGMHKIRLLPYSTATLNPLSLTYCLPPGGREPTFIPVVFNNSAPHQVVFNVHSLVTQKDSLESIFAVNMKHPVGWHARLTESDDGDDEDMDAHDLQAMVKRNKQLELARYHSVRPGEALSIVPPDLSSSESLLFLTIDRPSIITLDGVIDKRGDRFNIAPGHKAIVVECPTGGDFVDGALDKGGKVVPYKPPKEPVYKCRGSEDVFYFDVRGVPPLTAEWKHWVNGAVAETGLIEGIETKHAIEEAEQGNLHREHGDYISQPHVVTLRRTHSREGDHRVVLTSVKDGLGNVHTPNSKANSVEYKVLAKRSVAFDCDQPIDLLAGGTANLPIRADGPVPMPLDVKYRFTSLDGKESDHSVTVDSQRANVAVSEAGTFTLLDVSGTCPGTVLEPAKCSVQLIPRPTADINVMTLHECAMDVGVSVAFEFTGTPPFQVQWTEQRKGGPAVQKQHTFSSYGGQLDLRPDKEGKYTYKFTSLGDKRYSGVPIDHGPITQVVHPPANVEIKGSRTRSYWSCSGNDVDIDLSVKGNGPLKLNYRTWWGDRLGENVTIPIKAGDQRITVPLPKELSADSGRSGSITVTLTAVEDANGCVRRLPAQQVVVNVDREVPTAQFSRAEKVVVKEGDKVEVPLRLTGRGPWSITYTLDGKEMPKETIRQSNAPLILTSRGVYQITMVHDENCPGVADQAVYTIENKARPTAYLAESLYLQKHGKTYKHKGFCAGESDAVAVHFTGASPFDLSYKYQFNSNSAKDRSLKSAQDVGILHLQTEPGNHRYAFKTLTDSNYAKTPVDMVLEHAVYTRPSATFSHQNTRVLCRDTPLLTDAKVKLMGVPPFNLTVGVRGPASAEVSSHTIHVKDNSDWKVDLPELIVADVGRYEVSIMKIEDQSGCKYAFDDYSVLGTTVDVVETARVVPISPETDVCVGDTIDFLLQGTSPWAVEYSWEGKVYTVTSSAARFSRSADEAGVFAIHSVALKDRAGNPQCKRTVDGLERTIHPLPWARIQPGTDNLREGDKPATFTVWFTGTPPFTFSYTRSDVVNGRPRVAETQTITDVWESSYTISSSAPGDYEVTSVSDKFCRFPPLSRRDDV